jgi:hypothetical protein
MPTIPDVDQFVYIDTAVGGPNRRNNVVRFDRFEPPKGATDCYTTVHRFSAQLLDHMRRKKAQCGYLSVSGFEGDAYAPRLPFDFDDAGDVASAFNDGAQFVHTLINNYGVPPGAIAVYLSGGKGVHVELPKELFGGIEPSCNIAQQEKEVAVSLAGGLASFDHNIYHTLRLWRFPNTRHGKTGLYKIPLMVEEILGGRIGHILDLARSPRSIRPHKDSNWPAIPSLVDLWKHAKRAAEAVKKPTQAASTERIPRGTRSTTLVSLAGTMRRRGFSSDAIRAALLVENQRRCDPPLPDSEVERIAQSIGRYPEGTVSEMSGGITRIVVEVE